MKAFVPQFSGVQNCASANKAPTIKAIAIESLPKHADMPARDCNHDIRKARYLEQRPPAMRRIDSAGAARQNATIRASGAWAACPSERIWILRHQSISIERYRRLFLIGTLLDNSAFVHTNPARGQVQLVEIAVIVRDHHNSRAGFHQSRKKIIVEFAPKFGILFGRPFVKQKNWTFFKQANDQRQAPALAPGKIERTKLAVQLVRSFRSNGIVVSRRSTSPGPGRVFHKVAGTNDSQRKSPISKRDTHRGYCRLCVFHRG